MKCLPILGRNFFWKLYFFYHYVTYFYFWEEIYSEMCTNILEEISSESFIWHCNYRVSYFFSWEEIRRKFLLDIFAIIMIMYHSLMFGKKFILKCLPHIWEEILSESFSWQCCHWASYFYIFRKFIQMFVSILGKNILLKIVLDIGNIVYHTFICDKKFILKWVPSFRKKFLLKVFLNIVNADILLQIWEEIHCEICVNVLEENSSENITWNCYLWVSNFFLIFGSKIFL